MTSVPESHADLLTRALPAVLVTVMSSGRPQASVVWTDFTDEIASYIGPDHLTDPAGDAAPRVIVTLEPTVVHAYG
ncbi:MAG: hypothetical protein WA964_07000 [Ilumatobacter sp.]|uniref:hypothetical protein n=1 Tax=Ilumatobacter sp. TaxID=1967498 RepID=UPI003C71C86E